MNKYALHTVLVIAISLICTTSIKAQSLTLTGNNNKVTVEGTSSVHDWDMVLSQFKASGEYNGSGESTTIKQAAFEAKAENLSSDNSLMDKKAHDALKVKKHPEISFQQIGEVKVPASGNKSLSIKGNLTIAGKTNEVTTPVRVGYSGDKVAIEGTATIKMTDFDMEPPTAMFGTIKAGDEVKVHFTFEFTK